jgi:hypothetical protein
VRAIHKEEERGDVCGAVELGMGRIIIETDAILLNLALQSSEFNLARHGVLFWEAKFLLLTNFLDYRVMYCKRKCDTVAHVLATSGANLFRVE